MQFALPVSMALLMQAPPGGMRVQELLASHDPAQVAWGAEMAARSGSDDYVPGLRLLLARADDRVKDQALDALIRLKAKGPPEELTQVPPVLRNQVIILAILNGNPGILASFLAENPQDDATWVALNDGLVRAGAGQTYWPKRLREWTLHVVIYVMDPGRMPVIEPQSAAGSAAIASAKVARFPAPPTYGFFIDRDPATQFCSHVKSVCFRRASNPSGCDVQIDPNDYCRDFIASAANVAAQRLQNNSGCSLVSSK